MKIIYVIKILAHGPTTTSVRSQTISQPTLELKNLLLSPKGGSGDNSRVLRQKGINSTGRFTPSGFSVRI